ncbi:MAG: DMT family transporter [Betaproteobacteria bacterium]|nr:DMT family transporter [Betaproteobacteria bacterium]
MSAVTVPPRALVMLGVLTLVWGTNWPLFPLALQEISVWTFRSITAPTSGLILLAVARLRGLPMRIPREHWPTIAAASFFYLVVWNICSTYSALMIPSGQSAVLGYTMPLWSAVLSWAVLGQRLNGRLLVALALGTLSVVLLMVPSLGAYAQAPLGLGLGLLAGLGWAVGTLILKRRVIPVPVIVLTGWQMLIVSLPVMTIALLTGDRQWFIPNTQSIVLITYITLIPLCVGNVCWFSIVTLLPANIAGLSVIMVPMVAMVSGAWLLGEPLGPLQLGAMACCAASLALTLVQPARQRPA